MEKVVLTGGRGFVGESTIARLLASHPTVQVLVPTRLATPAQANPYTLVHPRVQYVNADVFDAPAMASLLQGTDVLVHLVGILHGSQQDFERVHVALPQQLAALAIQAKVGRVIHLSALGVGPNAPSHYLQSKHWGEQAWQNAFALAQAKGQAVPLLHFLRPSVIFGAHDRFTQLFAKLLRYSPFLPLPCAQALFQPVWVEDVAAAIARLAFAPPQDALALVIQAAGPKTMSLSQLVQAVGEMSGHQRFLIPLPYVLAWLQAFCMELWPGNKPMSVDNLRSMQIPNVANPQLPGLESLGITVSGLEVLRSALAKT